MNYGELNLLKRLDICTLNRKAIFIAVCQSLELFIHRESNEVHTVLLHIQRWFKGDFSMAAITYTSQLLICLCEVS